MTSRATIAVVDDDPEIRALVARLLRAEGYAVTQASDGAALTTLLARDPPDLLVLDIMMPGEDGLSICRRLRKTTAIPILMLTAKGDEIDRVIGLELGADDYLVKPFGPRELLARIRAVLRRVATHATPLRARIMVFDGLIVDLDRRKVTDGLDGPPLALTDGEFDLLACFLHRPLRVLSRDQITDWLRGRGLDPFERSVDMRVSRLRRKLEDARPGAGLIGTVRNGGYLLTAPVSSGDRPAEETPPRDAHP
jgi:DNA-binding response OmpR family regulator